MLPRRGRHLRWSALSSRSTAGQAPLLSTPVESGGPVPCQGADSCAGPALIQFDHMSPKIWSLLAHAYLPGCQRHLLGQGSMFLGCLSPARPCHSSSQLDSACLEPKGWGWSWEVLIPWLSPPHNQPGPATKEGLLSVRICPLNLEVKMWRAGCRKGSAVPISPVALRKACLAVRPVGAAAVPTKRVEIP